MELWIRSQDKEMLSKVNRIDIDTNGRKILINGFETIIGEYKTKERALEVLDEIQNIILIGGADSISEEISNIQKTITSWAATNSKTNIVIYAMPQE